MFSTNQYDVLVEALALLREAERKLNQARPLPVASGVDELTTGLSLALAGVKMILQDR
jgi:hypothetical protein